MRFGFDVRPFLRQETGVGTYLRNLLFHLAAIDRKNEYFLFSSSLKDRFDRGRIPPFARMTFKDWPVPVRAVNFFWQRWNQPPLDLIFRAPLDLTHSATPLPVPTHGKKVVTVHDLFFMDFPEQAGREAGKIFFRRLPRSLSRCDGMITFSSFTKREILSRFDVQEEKVRVIPHGLDRRFLFQPEPAEIDAVRKKCDLPSSFLLFVGAQEPRKNIVRLIEALNIVHLRGIRIPLVLVGPEGRSSKEIALCAGALGLEPWVRRTGYLRESDLPCVYRLASALVFPSLGEGFGFPLVEAMASGLPVAASRSSVMPEICGDAAVYFEPENAADMAEKMIAVLENRSLREKLISRGLKRAQDFSWERAAEETLDFYVSLVLREER